MVDSILIESDRCSVQQLDLTLLTDSLIIRERPELAPVLGAARQVADSLRNRRMSRMGGDLAAA